MDVDSEPLPLAPLAATLGAGAMALDPEPAGSWWQGWRRRISAVLPVAAMALLAALTWWLVKQAPRPEQAARPSAPGHVVDYEMRGFAVRHQGGAGLAASLVQGEHVRHYADDDSLAIQGVYLRSGDELGRVTEAWAEQALMDAQGHHLVLQGRARVRRSVAESAAAPVEFTSEWLAIDTQAERIHTDRAVTMVQGSSRFEAGGLDYDDTRDELILRGPVRGRVEAGRR